MLNRLFIKNYALIENLDIHFDAGLNIITGETGAGKSIMMGALGLILGNRAEGKSFFRDDQKCVIEGFFKISNYQLEAFFAEHELEYEAETIIRREISTDGKSRAFVNDSPVTLQVLKLLGEQLIDIHSQHATLQLGTEKFQLNVLDNVAKNQVQLADYQEKRKQYKQDQAALAQLQESIAQANAALDFNQFQFDELHEAQLQAEEQEQLEAEIKQLENAEEIQKGLSLANQLLSENELSVSSTLKEALLQLQAIARFSPAINPLSERLNSALIEVKDIADEVGTQAQDLDMDEQRLSTVQERLSLIYSLQKKHRVDTVDELIALRDELEAKIQVVAHQGEELEALERQVAKSLAKLNEAAEALHQTRQSAINEVEQYVQNTLAEVGMPHAQLNISLKRLATEQYKTSGADEVAFLFSANKGQALQAVQRVASGGELSRVMLAIKSLLAQSSALPTIIFDEIDTGISGEVALKVGNIMERLSANMQVLAITHLPQIASKGAAHFKVYKQDEGEKTKTDIVLLDMPERIQEVAQMLSGANPGDSALQHAKTLIDG